MLDGCFSLSNDHTGFSPPMIDAVVMNESKLFKLLFTFVTSELSKRPLLVDDVDEEEDDKEEVFWVSCSTILVFVSNGADGGAPG